jgi:hypothetical protein
LRLRRRGELKVGAHQRRKKNEIRQGNSPTLLSKNHFKASPAKMRQ